MYLEKSGNRGANAAPHFPALVVTQSRRGVDHPAPLDWLLILFYAKTLKRAFRTHDIPFPSPVVPHDRRQGSCRDLAQESGPPVRCTS